MLVNMKLKDTVAPNVTTDGEDVKRTKRALSALDLYRETGFDEFTPWSDSDMFDAIRGFQGANGLDVDAKIRPGGPTALLLNARVDARRRGRKAPPAVTPTASVGENGANDPRDVVKVRTALDRAGYDPVPDAGFAARQMDPNMVHALRIFQMDFNIPVDGRLKPGGRTATRLDEVARPLLAAERGDGTTRATDQPTQVAKSGTTTSKPGAPTNDVLKLSDQQTIERNKALKTLQFYKELFDFFDMKDARDHLDNFLDPKRRHHILPGADPDVAEVGNM